MAYTRYNEPIGTLVKFKGRGLVVLKIAKTCERAGRPKSWEDYPLFVTTQNAKTRYGAEYYYIQPVKNGPTLRIYFNVVPWTCDYGECIHVYRWDPLNDVYRLYWRGLAVGTKAPYTKRPLTTEELRYCTNDVLGVKEVFCKCCSNGGPLEA